MRIKLWAALVSVCLATACTRQLEDRPAREATAVVTATPPEPDQPAVAAEYGLVPGRRSFDEKDAPDYFIREARYPRGVFAVPMPDRPRLQAFDVDSNGAAICTRIEEPPFNLPDRVNARYARFQCPGDWTSRTVVFVDTTEFTPRHGEVLEWTALAGPSPLGKPGGRPGADLHDYAAVARPGC